jgi:hypothetical protein
METIYIKGKVVDFDAARMLMDDEICERLHGAVETQQDFMDAYLDEHLKKFGVEFVFG